MIRACRYSVENSEVWSCAFFDTPENQFAIPLGWSYNQQASLYPLGREQSWAHRQQQPYHQYRRASHLPDRWRSRWIQTL